MKVSSFRGPMANPIAVFTPHVPVFLSTGIVLQMMSYKYVAILQEGRLN